MIFLVTVRIKSYEVCFGVLALSLGRLCVCLDSLWFATKNAASSLVVVLVTIIFWWKT